VINLLENFFLIGVTKELKFFKLLKRRIDILNAEAELKFLLENK